MARMTVNGFDLVEGQLNRMGPPMIRQIVEAGAKAAEDVMKGNIQRYGHVRTGDMEKSVGMNEYREWYGSGSVDVYPLENDRYGMRNATKAYVINYGRGKRRKRGKMGDKFITGNEKQTEEAVTAAMQAESDRLMSEL